MSLFKRITSLAVAGVLATGLMLPSALAAKLPTDVQGTKYEESVSLLQALTIMVGDKDTGDFRLEENIKRSEVAKIAVIAAGLEDVAQTSNEKTAFPDVVSGHWATGYINVAAAQKFVIGDDYGNFRPDDTITFAEAATIFTRVLGYEPSAKESGGFPTGYLVVAGQIQLLKGGVSAGANTPATRGMIAMMSYNALTIDMMERTGYGSNEQYEVVDKTLLENKLEVTKNNGQVVANSESTLTGPSNLRKDEVQIKTTEGVNNYKINGTDAKDFLAKNVVFYVKESDNNDDKLLVLVREDSSRNATLEIASSDIDSVAVGSSDTTLSYWVNKDTDRKPQEVTLAADAKVFYNGVANANYDIANLETLQSGRVTLLDTDRADKYNYVFVTEYQNLVVEDVSTASYKINDKYNQLSLTLDPADKNIQFTMTKDGQPIGLADLHEWDILSVAMDQPTAKDSKVFNISVSSNKVTGAVTEINNDEFKIEGEYYKVSANYYNAGQPELKLNDEGTFYLDVEGRIAAVDTQTKAGSNYAYLIAADKSGGINERLEFQLYGKDGEEKIVKGADKIKVNGQSGLKADAAKAAIMAANGGTVAQLITYETNLSGEIYYVNTATDNTASGAPLKNTFSMDFKSGTQGVEYASASKKLGRFNVNSNTIVLDIPTGKTDSDDFAVRTIDMFVDKSSYDVELYDLSEDMTAKLVIVKNSSGKVNAEGAIAVVDNLADVRNEDEMATQKLYAVQNGERIELLAKDNTILQKEGGVSLQTGDIIQYTTNARGEIEKVTVLFDVRNREQAGIEVRTDFAGTEMSTIIGKVTKKFATSINVTSGNMGETNFDISNAKVYEYNYSKPQAARVSIVDASYITRYDAADAYKVFMRIYKGEVKELVLIKVQ